MTDEVMKKSHKDHLKKLEELMKSAKDLAKVADYFLTYLGEDRSFTKQGKLVEKHDSLETIARKITNGIFRKNWEAVSLFLIKATATDFYHGYATVGQCGINILYFENSGIGLLIVPVFGGESHFVRFATVQGDESAIPYYGPPIVE